MASVGLGAVGDYKLGGVLPLRTIFNASFAVGNGMRRLRGDTNGHAAPEPAVAVPTNGNGAGPV
jgi:hypothetical protein